MDFGPLFSDFMDMVVANYPVRTDSVLEIACGTGRICPIFVARSMSMGLISRQ